MTRQTRKDPKDPRDTFIRDLKGRQKNYVWPDIQAHTRGVDQLMLKGSRDATKTQRVGIALFGSVIFASACCVLVDGIQRHLALEDIAGGAFAAVGAWIVRNAFRRGNQKGSSSEVKS